MGIEMKDRLREAFGNDSQKVISEKLNITQGNVSKLLSGNQQPTLETIKNIAKVYGVSVDWLLGLSDENKLKSVFSYSNSVKVLMGMYKKSALELTDRNVVVLKDPLIVELLNKCVFISNADDELYIEWKNTRLSLFEDLTLLSYEQWLDDKAKDLLENVSTEAEWIKLCHLLKK